MNREKYTEKCTKAVVKQIAAADRISKKQARDRFTSSRTYHFLATDPGVTTKEAPENFFQMYENDRKFGQMRSDADMRAMFDLNRQDELAGDVLAAKEFGIDESTPYGKKIAAISRLTAEIAKLIAAAEKLPEADALTAFSDSDSFLSLCGNFKDDDRAQDFAEMFHNEQEYGWPVTDQELKDAMAKDESLRMTVEEMRLISEQMPDDLTSRPYEDQVVIYLPVLLREIAKLIAKSEQISPAAASDRFMSSKTCQELTTTALDIGSEDPVYYLQKYLNEQKYGLPLDDEGLEIYQELQQDFEEPKSQKQNKKGKKHKKHKKDKKKKSKK